MIGITLQKRRRHHQNEINFIDCLEYLLKKIGLANYRSLFFRNKLVYSRRKRICSALMLSNERLPSAFPIHDHLTDRQTHLNVDEEHAHALSSFSMQKENRPIKTFDRSMVIISEISNYRKSRCHTPFIHDRRVIVTRFRRRRSLSFWRKNWYIFFFSEEHDLILLFLFFLYAPSRPDTCACARVLSTEMRACTFNSSLVCD